MFNIKVGEGQGEGKELGTSSHQEGKGKQFQQFQSSVVTPAGSLRF